MQAASAHLRRSIVVLLVSTWLATGCATVVRPEETAGDLRAGRLDPCHVVFTCHGMLFDFGSPWDRWLREELADAGVVPIQILHFTSPTGVWFNWGAVRPGRLIADLADRITELHRESGGSRPLILDAVGFSAGCETLIHAARQVRVARFRRFHLVRSSSFAWSGEVGDLVASGRVGSVVHEWSPIDGLTVLAPLGGGQFGLRNCGGLVENRLTWWPHGPLAIRGSKREAIIDELLDARRPAPVSGGLADEVAKLLSPDP